ncbi:hypothetical protein NVV43_27290, partial [Escherichia marmotae]|nr:hypothetical protein [Escherichia marmotae]
MLLGLVFSSLALSSFAEASEANLPKVQGLAKLSDFDLAQAYLTVQRLIQTGDCKWGRQFSAEVKFEIQKR